LELQVFGFSMQKYSLKLTLNVLSKPWCGFASNRAQRTVSRIRPNFKIWNFSWSVSHDRPTTEFQAKPLNLSSDELQSGTSRTVSLADISPIPK
jgi:hypothetical protein